MTEEDKTPEGPGHDKLRSVRERTQALLRDSALKLAEAAKRIGIGESTLAAWLGGTYAGDNERVAQKVSLWLSTQDVLAEKRQALPVAVPFALTPAAFSITSALEHAQMLPDMVVITGGAGVGKTIACSQYLQTHAAVWRVTADPSIASAFGLLDHLGDTLGLAEHAPQKRGRAVMARLRNTQGLLIVDEAQHLRGSAIEMLRAIHDEAQIGLALVGNEAVWSRVDGGGRKAEFAQLYSRVGMRVTIARASARDVAAVLDVAEVADGRLRNFLRGIAGRPGALRQMAKCLRVARMLALADRAPLSELHLGMAWRRLAGVSDGAEDAPA